MQIERHPTPVPIPMSSRYVLVGLADLHSGYIMPVLKDRKYCIKEAKSKYIPHVGPAKCQRKKITN